VRVLGLTRQENGGGYYRMHLPLAELARHGHKTITAPARTDVQVDRDAVDVIVGQMIGHVPGWWRRLRMSAPLVYELDDDPFEVETHNPVYAAYAAPVTRDCLAHCIEVSDLVTVSTEPLAERMRKHNPNVAVVQNRIDEHLLALERPRRDKVTIGWAGGASHLEDIRICAHGLRKTLDRFDVEAHFIGADFTPLIRRSVRHTPWCEKTVDYYQLIDFDIGLAPLRPTVFAETKSHIKALEYAALGIPVVASDSAPYRDFVIDGVTGWIVRRDHEWASRLRDLVNDEAMRAEMGLKAKELAAEWTIQKGYQDWEAAYKSIL
jgi:glycosyltransferase involved in cell wall biosynthesis